MVRASRPFPRGRCYVVVEVERASLRLAAGGAKGLSQQEPAIRRIKVFCCGFSRYLHALLYLLFFCPDVSLEFARVW